MKKALLILLAAVMCLALTACGAESATTAEAAVTLTGDGAEVSGEGVTVSGSVVTITSGGSYEITGELTDGQIVVDSDGAAVTLLLNGVSITNLTDDAIHIDDGNVTIELAAGSTNTLTSGEALPEEIPTETSGAALFSKSTLTLTGEGELEVLGYINNGVAARGGLTIVSGTISVTAANNGIKSADGSIAVSGGTVTVDSLGDGVSAGGDLDIAAGTVTVTCGDGSIAEYTAWDDTTRMDKFSQMIESGEITMPEMPAGETPEMPAGEAPTGEMTAGERPEMPTGEAPDMTQMPQSGMGGGAWFDDMNDAFADATDDTSASMKGIKCDGNLTVSGGVITVNSTDHSLHAKGDITVSGGEITLASSAGKGVSAHGNVTITDGRITVTGATEGIESKAILTVDGGEIDITCSDDGLNAGGTTGTHRVVINGGTLTIDANGDGIDSNGDIEINGGFVLIEGPVSGADGAIDSGIENGGSCVVNGGTVIAAGSSAMAEGFGANSAQCSFMYNFASSVAAGSEIAITDSAGEVIYSAVCSKAFSSIVFSSAELEIGETYTLTAGGESAEITLDSVCVTGGSAGTGMGGFGGGQMPDGDMSARPGRGGQ